MMSIDRHACCRVWGNCGAVCPTEPGEGGLWKAHRTFLFWCLCRRPIKALYESCLWQGMALQDFVTIAIFWPCSSAHHILLTKFLRMWKLVYANIGILLKASLLLTLLCTAQLVDINDECSTEPWNLRHRCMNKQGLPHRCTTLSRRVVASSEECSNWYKTGNVTPSLPGMPACPQNQKDRQLDPSEKDCRAYLRP